MQELTGISFISGEHNNDMSKARQERDMKDTYNIYAYILQIYICYIAAHIRHTYCIYSVYISATLLRILGMYTALHTAYIYLLPCCTY